MLQSSQNSESPGRDSERVSITRGRAKGQVCSRPTRSGLASQRRRHVVTPFTRGNVTFLVPSHACQHLAGTPRGPLRQCSRPSSSPELPSKLKRKYGVLPPYRKKQTLRVEPPNAHFRRGAESIGNVSHKGGDTDAKRSPGTGRQKWSCGL